MKPADDSGIHVRHLLAALAVGRIGRSGFIGELVVYSLHGIAPTLKALLTESELIMQDYYGKQLPYYALFV